MEVENQEINKETYINNQNLENNNNNNINNNIDLEEEEEDDWQPSGYNDTILNKVKVDYSDKKIKFLENKLDKKERKQMANGEFTENNIKNEEFAIPKSKKSVNKNSNNQQKQQQQDLENDSDDSSDNEDNIDVSKPEFYDPLKDEKYEDWVNHKLKKEDEQQIVLSCPSCFQQLCYNCQSHQQFENQYRSFFVQHVKIDCQKIVTPKFINKNNKQQKKKTKQQNLQQQQQKIDNSNFQTIEELIKSNTDKKFTDKQLEDQYYLENKRQDFEIFFATFCDVCNAEVGVFEADSKLYIFHNVIPSLG